MTGLRLPVLFAFLALAFAIDGIPEGLLDTKPHPNVIDLDVDNYDETIAKHTNILVEFYAPWCGHCESLRPDYEGAAKQLADDKWEHGVMARIDATKNKDSKEMKALKQKTGTRGFPNLVMYVNGVGFGPKFEGGMIDKKTLLSLMRRHTGQTAHVMVEDKAAMDKHVKQHIDNGGATVGFFPDTEHPAYMEFKKAAAEASTAGETGAFAVCTDAAMAKEVVDGPSPFVMFFKAGQEVDMLSEKQLTTITADQIQEWVTLRTNPTILEYGRDTAIVRGSTVKFQLMVAHTAAQKEDPELNEEYTRLTGLMTANAKAYMGRLLMVTVDGNKKGGILSQMGWTLGDLPRMALLNLSSPAGTMYRHRLEKPSEEIDNSTLNSWLESFGKGELPKYVSSEDNGKEPVDDSEVNFKTFTGNNYESHALDQEFDSLVMFYHKDLTAQWMFKEVEAVADKFGHVDSVLVGKFNVEYNELHPPNKLLKNASIAEQLPALFMFPGSAKGKANPEQYFGEIDADEIVEFMKKRVETIEIDDGSGGDDEEEEEEEGGGEDSDFEL